jgi:hypothetical protein
MATDLSDIRKLVAESNFDVLSFSVDALTGDEELLTGIPVDCIPCAKRNAMKKFLLLYSSSKNSKPCSTVTNPTSTEGEELDGLWRCIGVDFQVAWNKKEYLIRKLRKGYATAIDWTEARLVEGKNQQPLGAINYKSLTVRWLNCSRATVQAMAASLNTTPFVDPVVNGEKQVGTWYNSGVTPSIAADGSGIITLQLSQQYRDTGYLVSSVAGDTKAEVRQQLGVTTETVEPIVQTAGIIKHQQVSVKEDSSKDVHTTKETAILISTPEYIAAINEHETVYRLEEKHAAAIPVIALGANDASVSLSHDLDDFLTHNYTKTRVVRSFPFDGEKTWTIWGDREIVTSQIYSDTLGRYWNDHSYLYHLYQEITIKYFKTVDEAIAYIHLASGTEPAGSGYTVIDSAGSGWSRTGEYEYEARKVRNKKLLMATYNYLEPLS